MTPRTTPILRPAILLALVASLSLFAGCTLEFEEDFDTKFTVPKPIGSELTFWKTKRFKLKKDPKDAEHVELDTAKLRVLSPDGADLSFINEIEVYACRDTSIEACHGEKPTAERVPVGFADDFVPGDTSKHIDIVFTGDLRQFVEDKRLVLVFRVKRSIWGYDWPEDGVKIEAAVILQVEAEAI